MIQFQKFADEAFFWYNYWTNKNMFVQKGKTNWIFVIAVALIAGIVGGGSMIYINDTIQQMDSSLAVVGSKNIDKKNKNSNADLNLPLNMEIPIPQDIAKWKTFQYLDYGVEIKYPPAGMVEDPDGRKIKNILTSKGSLKESSDVYFSVTDDFSEESCYSTINGYGASEFSYRIINGIKISTAKNLFGNNTAKPAFDVNIYFPERNLCVLFEFSPFSGTDEEKAVLYDMVSVVSLIEPQVRSVKIVSPNGGEELKAGGTYTINWDAKNVSMVNLYLEEQNNRWAEQKIVEDIPVESNKSYTWTIPDGLPSSRYFIKIVSHDQRRSVEDLSDNDFAIVNLVSIKEKEQMLNQMFEGVFSLSGNRINSPKIDQSYGLYLAKIVGGSFSKANAKEYFFIVSLAGVSHVGGLDHEFVGIFDENKKLLTSRVDITQIFDIDDPLDVYFSSDFIDFGFYDCAGITYIFVTSKHCVNGWVCESFGGKLLQLQNGRLNIAQEILNKKIFVLGKNKIDTYKWYFKVAENYQCQKPECLETNYINDEYGNAALLFSESIPFDNQTCKFNLQ
jgi:hypothetical protein